MLHAKFQDHRTSGYGEECLKGLTIYGRGGHLGHVDKMSQTSFCSPYSKRLHKKCLIGQAVSEKKMFEHCGRRRRRTPE